MMKQFAALTLAAVMTVGMGLAATADVISASGRAVFDFGDKAFFSVKMFSEEKVLLNLDTAYQNQIEENGLDFESFYNFVGTCDTFYATGELLLPGEKGLLLYEIGEDGELTPLESEYVSNYTTVRGGGKVNGYLIYTKTLGNYGLARE